MIFLVILDFGFYLQRKIEKIEKFSISKNCDKVIKKVRICRDLNM